MKIVLGQQKNLEKKNRIFPLEICFFICIQDTMVVPTFGKIFKGVGCIFLLQSQLPLPSFIPSFQQLSPLDHPLSTNSLIQDLTSLVGLHPLCGHSLTAESLSLPGFFKAIVSYSVTLFTWRPSCPCFLKGPLK